MSNKRTLDLSPLIRFLGVIPVDKELALLKAHLVIEEVLTKIICQAMSNEKYVLEANLSFSQKCKIVRACNNFDNDPWLWQALKLLNKARNELAHNLTSLELETKIKSFTNHIQAQNPGLFEASTNEKFTEFHMAAYATYIPLATYANFEPAQVNLPTTLGGCNA